MKRLTFFLILFSTLIAAAAWASGDIKRGEKLLNDNCFGCHDTSVYTRPHRIVNSLPELQDRVRFCETQNGLSWKDQDIEDVTAYLNAKFYKF
jgi:cytochrome c2